MLFDYIFIIAIGLDWLVLGLVIFGGKTWLAPVSKTDKRFSLPKYLLNFLLFLLVLIFTLKILFSLLIGLELKNSILPDSTTMLVLSFVLVQIIFAVIFLMAAMAFYVKDGFNDKFRAIWLKRVSAFLVVSLIVDFFFSFVFYFLMLLRLMSGTLQFGNLALKYHPLSPVDYWLSLGLILTIIVYFIFYLTLKHNRPTATIVGLGLSYLLTIIFGGLLVSNYFFNIAPQPQYLLNSFALYSTGIVWGFILLIGAGSFFLILLFFRKRKDLKNEFYFKYLLVRLSGLNAVSLVGFSLITLVPVVFFTVYR